MTESDIDRLLARVKRMMLKAGNCQAQLFEGKDAIHGKDVALKGRMPKGAFRVIIEAGE